MPWYVMSDYETHADALEHFRWDIPGDYDPVEDFLRKHEEPDQRPALIDGGSGEGCPEYSFQEIDELSDRFAVGLSDRGIRPGDRVGVLLPQRVETPVSHLGVWKAGAVTVPLTTLFGTDALTYRIRDAGIRLLVVGASELGKVRTVREDCEELERVLVVDGEARHPTEENYNAVLSGSGGSVPEVERSLTTSSALMYTSGSTGPPKGVLHSFGIWLGRAAAAHNYFDQDFEEAVLWTPADWAWGMALGGTLLAAWHHGCPIVSTPWSQFDPESAFELMQRRKVTHASLPPTALRMMMQVNDPARRFDLDLRTLASAGESLTPEIVDWVHENLPGVSINEFYGQTELNLIVGNCSRWFETRPGSMGKPFPGYRVAVLDPDTHEPLDRGEVGEIGVKPMERAVFFKEYWDRPEATEAKQKKDWFLTGDLAERDEDGYLWFKSRRDDVIITSGYRVGPTEVEQAVLRHPAVEQVGVIGVPDETRGEVIKAFVETDGNFDPDRLREEIQRVVRERLAEYEYPRIIEFVDELPRTSTGKIRRSALRED